MSNIYITQGWQKRGGEIALKNLLTIDNTLSESIILNLGDRDFNIKNIKEIKINILKSLNILSLLNLYLFLFKYNQKKYKFYYVNGNIVKFSFVLFFVNLLSDNKVKLVVWEHCLPHKHWDVNNILKKSIIKYFYYLLINMSYEIIVPSAIIKNELLPSKKSIKIFNNPLIVNTFPDCQIIPLIREENINIIYVGALSLEKNPFLFLEIISKAVSVNSSVRGFLIGNGDLKEQLLTKIKELQLERVVSIIDWRENIHSIINRCSIVIITSKFETYCNVIAESLALGSVVFSTQWDGVKSIYEDKIFYLSMDLDYDVKNILSSINTRKFCMMEKQIIVI